MQITEKHQKEIENIMEDIECPKDFICYQSGFEQLCQAQDIGLEEYVDCSGDPTSTLLCPFSLSFGDRYMCRCPVRIYLVKKLKI